MSPFYESVDAYAHNEDRDFMRSLGLRTSNFGRDWTDLGTVVVQEAEEREYGRPQVSQTRPAATVKVEVCAFPAQFWRFTITRPLDEIEELGEDERGLRLWRSVYEPCERFVVKTGSGGFTDYWPSVKLIADHVFDIEKKESE